MTDDDQPQPSNDLTLDDIAYWMAWHMDSQMRIYDVLLANLAAQGYGDKAKQLQTLHERGEFLYPPPDGGNDETD